MVKTMRLKRELENRRVKTMRLKRKMRTREQEG